MSTLTLNMINRVSLWGQVKVISRNRDSDGKTEAGMASELNTLLLLGTKHLHSEPPRFLRWKIFALCFYNRNQDILVRCKTWSCQSSHLPKVLLLPHAITLVLELQKTSENGVEDQNFHTGMVCHLWRYCGVVRKVGLLLFALPAPIRKWSAEKRRFRTGGARGMCRYFTLFLLTPSFAPRFLKIEIPSQN